MIFDNNFNYLFIVLILFSIFYIYLEYKSSKVKFVESTSGNTYLVRNCDNALEASNLLDALATNGTKLMNHFRDNLDSNDEYKTYRPFIERLINNYDPTTISESSPSNEYTSYTINKGKKIVFCIRQKPPTGKKPSVHGCGELVSVNTMMFVFLHELGHLGTCSIGHPPEFWCNMAFLLKVGEEIGIYDPLNTNNDIPYCGINITSAPDICPGHIPEQSCNT